LCVGLEQFLVGLGDDGLLGEPTDPGRPSYVALIGCEVAGQDAQQGGLSGAVRADDVQAIAGLDLQAAKVETAVDLDLVEIGERSLGAAASGFGREPHRLRRPRDRVVIQPSYALLGLADARGDLLLHVALMTPGRLRVGPRTRGQGAGGLPGQVLLPGHLLLSLVVLLLPSQPRGAGPADIRHNRSHAVRRCAARRRPPRARRSPARGRQLLEGMVDRILNGVARRQFRGLR
jgi:hypothetical protein